MRTVPGSSTIHDLKAFLQTFKDEMYVERGGKNTGEYYLHFYKKARGKDCATFLANTPS